MKSKRSDKELPLMKVDEPKQAEVLINDIFVCHKTGTIYKIDEFRNTPLSNNVLSVKGLDTRDKIAPETKSVLSVEKHFLIRTAPKQKTESQNVLISYAYILFFSYQTICQTMFQSKPVWSHAS